MKFNEKKRLAGKYYDERIEATEMWIYRRVVNIPQIEKKQTRK